MRGVRGSQCAERIEGRPPPVRGHPAPAQLSDSASRALCGIGSTPVWVTTAVTFSCGVACGVAVVRLLVLVLRDGWHDPTVECVDCADTGWHPTQHYCECTMGTVLSELYDG